MHSRVPDQDDFVSTLTDLQVGTGLALALGMFNLAPRATGGLLAMAALCLLTSASRAEEASPLTQRKVSQSSGAPQSRAATQAASSHQTPVAATTGLPPVPQVTRTQRATEWYGGWIIGVDLLTLAGTIALQDGRVFLAGQFIGAPIVHGVHGEYGSAFISAGIRAGIPLAGGAIGATGTDSGWGRLGAVAVGLAIGHFVAATVDASVLARREVESPSVSVAPFVTETADGSAVYGLGGTF